jgi:hypothetical protein
VFEAANAATNADPGLSKVGIENSRVHDGDGARRRGEEEATPALVIGLDRRDLVGTGRHFKAVLAVVVSRAAAPGKKKRRMRQEAGEGDREKTETERRRRGGRGEGQIRKIINGDQSI